MGVVMALIGNTSAVSFDVNFNPDGPARFVNQYAGKVNDFVNDNMEDIQPVVIALKPPLEEYLMKC
jgi:hypothetical protein